MASELLRREIRRKGGAAQVAKDLSVTPQAVYYWMNGKRTPSDELLAYLGLKKIERLVRA
jgi:transcriptional regulator with XRE-family HTH domain